MYIGTFVTESASGILEQPWGSIAHLQEVWLPRREFGEKGKGLLFKGYTDLE